MIVVVMSVLTVHPFPGVEAAPVTVETATVNLRKMPRPVLRIALRDVATFPLKGAAMDKHSSIAKGEF